MTEKDLEIKELRKEMQELKEEKQFIINYIEQNCVYDEHLKGYCFDLSKGKVRTLMFKINNENENREIR